MTEEREEEYANAKSPTLVTDDGIETEFKLER